MRSVVDVPALLLALAIALAITVALMFADRNRSRRRGWLTAAALAAAMIALGSVDLVARSWPRETHFTTVVVGALLPVLGALGLVRATRLMRPWIRWPLVFVTAFILLFGGLLLGATLASRFIPI